MIELKSVVWKACNNLQQAQLLITNNSITRYLITAKISAEELKLINNNLHTWINEWRISQVNQRTIPIEQKSFNQHGALETELYKYKNNLYRVSQKCKLLEKKIRSLQTNHNKKQQLVKDTIFDLLHNS